MQPNGNTPGAARPVAGAPVNNVNTVPTSMPTPKPEPAFGNGGSVVEGKGGKKTGWILAIVFLLIVAAGGVGFGVWAMMDGNAQKDVLNSQISALKQQNSELQDKLGNGGDTIINIDADGNEVNTADYIYVGEWGLKIKIPENLEDINYVYLGDGYAGLCTTVGVSAAIAKNGSGVPSFVKSSVESNSYLGYIQRCPLDVEYEYYSSTVSVEDDEFRYYYNHPQDVYSIDEAEKSWETESVDLIQSMLTNMENYSKI